MLVFVIWQLSRMKKYEETQRMCGKHAENVGKLIKAQEMCRKISGNAGKSLGLPGKSLKTQRSSDKYHFRCITEICWTFCNSRRKRKACPERPIRLRQAHATHKGLLDLGPQVWHRAAAAKPFLPAVVVGQASWPTGMGASYRLVE